MCTTERAEAQIVDVNNVLVVASALKDAGWVKDFCGSVVTPDDLLSRSFDFSRKTVYLCGDVSRIGADDLHAAERVLVIRELSPGYDEGTSGKAWASVDLGRVPVRIHGVGVYYRRFFAPGLRSLQPHLRGAHVPVPHGVHQAREGPPHPGCSSGSPLPSH